MPPITDLELAARGAEFRAFVWNHAADAFQAKFDACATLEPDELIAFKRLLSTENLHDVERMTSAVAHAVAGNSALLRRLLQLVGLTRNKIIQDIKAFARENNLNVPLSSPEALFRTNRGALLAGEYLGRQLIRVFAHANPVNDHMLEALNQATWPGYIRQERAKRMGHEAEYRLACLLRDLNLPFAPQEKAENPLCRDIQIGGMSYDLVSPSGQNALLRVVSTVHTANIGQYGESKDDLEIRKAIAAIEAERARGVTLLAFIDGVGFESNTAGLTGVLRNADEFCQFRTIWKAGAIAAAKNGFVATVALPIAQHARFADFARRHRLTLTASEALGDAPEGWVPAGDGYIRLSR